MKRFRFVCNSWHYFRSVFKQTVVKTVLWLFLPDSYCVLTVVNHRVVSVLSVCDRLTRYDSQLHWVMWQTLIPQIWLCRLSWWRTRDLHLSCVTSGTCVTVFVMKWMMSCQMCILYRVKSHAKSCTASPTTEACKSVRYPNWCAWRGILVRHFYETSLNVFCQVI